MDVEVKPTELISVKSIKDSDYILISYLRFSYKVLASDFFNYVKNYISNSSGKPKLTFSKPKLGSLDKTLNTSNFIEIKCESSLPVKYKWYFNGVLVQENFTGIYNIESLSTDHFGNYFVIAENENGYSVSEVLEFN